MKKTTANLLDQGIIKSPSARHVRVKVEAVCHCRDFHTHPHRHTIETEPDLFGRAAFDWFHKHANCEAAKPGSVEYLSPTRFIPRSFDDEVYEQYGEAPWWLEYKHNADIKIAYAADAQVTITLASLATSSDWTTGRESNTVDNGTNKYLDYEVTGKVTTGTTPTVSTEMRLYAIRPINDTPTWPDTIDATDSAETITNTNILDRLPLIWSHTVTATSNVTYPIVNAISLAQLWGFPPNIFSFYFAHATAVNLNSTGSNHELTTRGIYLTST